MIEAEEEIASEEAKQRKGNCLLEFSPPGTFVLLVCSFLFGFFLMFSWFFFPFSLSSPLLFLIFGAAMDFPGDGGFTMANPSFVGKK